MLMPGVGSAFCFVRSHKGSTEASFAPRRGGGKQRLIRGSRRGCKSLQLSDKAVAGAGMELISSPNDDYSRGRAGPTLRVAREDAIRRGRQPRCACAMSRSSK